MQNSTQVTEISKARYSAKVVDSYPEYNLTAESIIRDGKDTNTQLIIKNDKFYHFSNKYKVLPNEEAFKVADTIRESAGLVWAKKKDGLQSIPKFMGNMDRAITALLIDPEEINLTAGMPQDDDFMKFGLGIGSSINGSSSLKVFGFTVRAVCKNYAFHKFHLGQIRVDAELNPASFNDAKFTNKQVFIHSSNLDIAKFEESCRAVLKQGKRIAQRYRDMMVEKLMEEQVQKIARRFPSTLLKNDPEIQKWLEWKKGFGFVLTPVAKKRGITTWKAFNDITDVLTHDTKIGYETKMDAYSRLDRVLVAPQAS